MTPRLTNNFNRVVTGSAALVLDPPLNYYDNDMEQGPNLTLFVCLGFNGTFSTNRLYRTITVGKYVTYGQETTQIHNKTMKQYN